MIRNKAAAYGLLAIYEIAKRHRGTTNPSGIQAGEVAQKYKLPVAYAAKIMSQLARRGILRSDRGPHGGFRLNRSPDKINLWDILDAVGGLGPDGGKPFTGYPAAVQNVLNRAHADSMARLRDICKNITAESIM